MRSPSLYVLALGALWPGAAAQDPRKSAVDSQRVDEAIRRGVEFLKRAPSPAGEGGIENSDELILLTLLHAGLGEEDSKVRDLLGRVLEAPLRHTYKVALQAMVLEELDRVKHQKRIFHCAQFLVDNQSPSGQWSYGKPTILPDFPAGVPTKAANPVRSATGVVEFGGPRTKPPVRQKVAVKRLRAWPAAGDEGTEGDNSNSQYAALGLRACHDAGIVIPSETIARAAAWWRKTQLSEDKEREEEDNDDRGNKPAPGKRVATGGGAARPRGWGYSSGEDPSGSMTAGAVGSLVIYDYIQGKDWKKDPDIADGMSWLASRFTVRENPGRGAEWHFYYLYALERVGMLYGTDLIGGHAWYAAGATWLLDSQNPDGSWGKNGSEEEDTTWNTCFALLFLRRSTRPLVDVASVDRFRPEK